MRFVGLALCAALSSCKKNEAPPAAPCRATPEAPLALEQVLRDPACRTERGDISHLKPSIPAGVEVSSSAPDGKIRSGAQNEISIVLRNRSNRIESVVMQPSESAPGTPRVEIRLSDQPAPPAHADGGFYDLVRFEMEPNAEARGSLRFAPNAEVSDGSYTLELSIPGLHHAVTTRVRVARQ